MTEERIKQCMQANKIILNHNPTSGDSIIADGIEYIYKSKPYANNHILIGADARASKEHMIEKLGDKEITEIYFTSIENYESR